MTQGCHRSVPPAVGPPRVVGYGCHTAILASCGPLPQDCQLVTRSKREPEGGVGHKPGPADWLNALPAEGALGREAGETGLVACFQGHGVAAVAAEASNGSPVTCVDATGLGCDECREPSGVGGDSGTRVGREDRQVLVGVVADPEAGVDGRAGEADRDDLDRRPAVGDPDRRLNDRRDRRVRRGAPLALRAVTLTRSR